MGRTAMSDFERNLIGATERRMSAELLCGFQRLPHDAQLDVALTLLYCAPDLPPVLDREHVDTLRNAVDALSAKLLDPADVAR